MLLERESEQAALGGLLDRAAEGSGGILVLHGPAGIGKTGLMGWAYDTARTKGMTVGRARGGSLEQEFAFGAVRQLLEPLVASADHPRRLFQGAAAAAEPILRSGQSDAAEAGTVLHGLYWVTAALAEQGPLAFVLDDAHWFDGPSLRYLAYLAVRVDELPVAMVVATRAPEPGPEGELLGRVLDQHAAAIRHVAPLSTDGVATLVRGAFDAEDSFCSAVAEVTRGNPFLVAELVRTVGNAGLPTDAAGAAQVGDVVASTAVLGRLARLSPEALELARAVAVLGSDAHLRHGARLAGLDVETAAAASDELLRADILGPERPLAFVHPLVASAVHNGLLPGSRASLHRRAARLLAEEGAPDDAIATHLLACEAEGDPWVVATLVSAARSASARGATDVAIRLLRRALAEPPPLDDRFGILFELGASEALVSDEGAVDHLGEVLGGLPDPTLRLTLGVSRGITLAMSGRQKEAVESLDDFADAEPPIPELEHLAGTVLLGMTGPTAAPLIPDRISALTERVGVDSDASGIALGVRSFVGAFANEPAGAMADLAARSLTMLDPDDLTLPVWYHLPCTALVMADRFDVASGVLEDGLAVARRLGAPSHLGVSLFLRGWIAYRQGQLDDAEADARAALEVQQLHGNDFLVPGPLALLVDVLRERDELDAADAALERYGYGTGDGDSLFHLFLLRSRGQLRGAQRRWDDWIADATRGIERYAANGGVCPGFLAFDADLVKAHAATGDMRPAVEHAHRALELARVSGGPRALAEGLRAVAMVDPDAPADHGEQALDLFEQASAVLERAWTLHNLAVTNQRWGDGTRATELFAGALELADRCGAARLAAMARRALSATGARPRRTQLVGVGALTPSERRVTSLAALGRTNKEVAQELFVTVKTVETHLAHAYQKLQIGSRSELAAALEGA